MITIPLRITGETWYNVQEFRDAFNQLPDTGQYVAIDVNSEGPSLSLFGIYEILSTKHENNYMFVKWSNPVEPSHYPKIKCGDRSHFFTLSRHYWIEEKINGLAENVFGLFVGRNSTARNYILWDMYNTWNSQTLLSKMTSENQNIWDDNIPEHAIKKDTLDEWADPRTQEKIKNWWKTHKIPSIDNKSIRDQYQHPEQSAAACVLSLLSHYDKFNFELVCETYTRGCAFFPTEKTIRAIMGNKPFLVYGPINFLKNLQSLGFKTFSGIWNEQYDQYEGPMRWQSMKQVVNMINNWDLETRKNVLIQCSIVTRHNRNRLMEIINDC